jgi:hypothetical protein
MNHHHRSTEIGYDIGIRRKVPVAIKFESEYREQARTPSSAATRDRGPLFESHKGSGAPSFAHFAKGGSVKTRPSQLSTTDGRPTFRQERFANCPISQLTRMSPDYSRHCFGPPIESRSAMISGGSRSVAALRFSRRCPTEDVPGINRMLGER